MERMVQDSRTIDLQELRAFASVVRRGGITAAVRIYSLSKSTISMQLTRLETRIGVRLLERTSRRIALTREGEQLLPRIVSILAEVDYLLDDTLRARTSPRGTVRIAVPLALGGALLGQLVSAVAERYPDIALIVQPSYDIECCDGYCCGYGVSGYPRNRLSNGTGIWTVPASDLPKAPGFLVCWG